MAQFSGYANYYDDMYMEKNYEAETKLIEKVFTDFSDHPVESVLSLGCGTGTYEILLAKDGYKLTGVDLSEDMLEKAKKKIEEAGVEDSIDLVNSDIRTLPDLGKQYDAAIMMFNIAGYLHTPGDLTEVAKQVSKYLKPGGTFQFDAWYEPAVVADPPSDRVRTTEHDDKKITRKTSGSLDEDHKLVNIKFDVTEEENGEVVNHVVEDHPMRYWSTEEITMALQEGGLELVKTSSFEDLDKPESPQHWDMQAIAKKA